MILTQRQKEFIIKHREDLKSIFKTRLEELKEEASLTPRGNERDAKIDLSQELRIWLRDIELVDKPVREKPNNII